MYHGESPTAKDVGIEALRFVLVIACLFLGGFIMADINDRVEQSKGMQETVLSSEMVMMSEPTEEELARAHRYHGTQFSEQAKDGSWWFTNERGERCRLFPDRCKP